MSSVGWFIEVGIRDIEVEGWFAGAGSLNVKAEGRFAKRISGSSKRKNNSAKQWHKIWVFENKPVSCACEKV